MSTDSRVPCPQDCRACMKRIVPVPYRVSVTRHQSGHPGISLEFETINWRCPKCGERGLIPTYEDQNAVSI